MESNVDTILLALKISGIGLFILLLVLVVLAFVVSLLTRFIKDAPEEGEENDGNEDETSDHVVIAQENDLGKIAAIAVAIARAQSDFSTTTESAASNLNNWGQFHLNRRLNLSSSIRRSK